MALLEVRNLTVYYGSVLALQDVSFTVGEGELVSLLGPNGAGKTTTLRTISGMIGPRSGEIIFDGQPIQGLPAQEVVGLGLAHLPEGRELFPSLTVEENLRLGSYSKRKTSGYKNLYKEGLERAFTYFPKLKERRNQPCGTMSGGEQQMLGMARALMSRPKLLVVDEMSLGLAPIIVEQLFDILEDVNRDGTAALVVEQFVNMALGHTNRAYVLSRGQIALEGPSRQLRDDPELLASYLGSEAEGAHA